MVNGFRKLIANLRRLPWRRTATGLSLSAAYLAAYLLLDRFTRTFQTLPGISPWYPPNALSLTLVASLGRSYFPVLFLASLISNLLVWRLQLSPVDLALLSAIPAAGYALAGLLLRRLMPTDAQLTSLRDVIWFSTLALLAPVPIAAAAAWQSLRARLIADLQLQRAFLDFWVGDVVGVLVLAPFLMVNLIPWIRYVLRAAPSEQMAGFAFEARPDLRRALELAGIVVSIPLLSWLVFGAEALGAGALVYPLFLPLIWAALRYGLRGATAATLGINASALLFASGGQPAGLDLADLQLFMILLSLTGLILGAIVSDERRTRTALSEQEEQYRRIFESTSDGLLLLSVRGVLIDFNPAARLMLGYPEEEFRHIRPESLIQPDSLPRFTDFLSRVSAGEEVVIQAKGIRRDGTTLITQVKGAPFTLVGTPHILALIRDITQEALAKDQLERRVEERTRELAALLDLSREVAATVETGAAVSGILTKLNDVLDFRSGTILTSEADWLSPVATFGLPPQTQTGQAKIHPPLAEKLNGLIEPHAPVNLKGYQASALVRSLWREVGGGTHPPAAASGCALLPLLARQRPIGLLQIERAEPGPFDGREIQLGLAFAHLASAAIENERLFRSSQDRRQEAERRRAVASSLAEIMAALNSDRPLDDVLQVIVHQAALVLGSSTVAIYELNPEADTLSITASEGIPEEYLSAAVIPVGTGAIGRAVEQRAPVVLSDLALSLAADLENVEGEPGRALRWLRDSFDTILAVPLVIRGEAYGGISLYYPQRRDITPEEIDLAVAFSDQAALGIENSRLHEQSQYFAALQERQRISRNLHDSVSQALYGIVLGARTAQKLAARDDEDISEPLDYVVSLAEGAQAEMRALILELRPEALEEEGLTGALLRQAESIRARHGIRVEADLGAEPALSTALTEALYRIGLEALQNAVRHASPAEIIVRMNEAPDHITLEIADDGVGFDPAAEYPGHLGLKSMRERAAAVSGDLHIKSRPGKGTLVRASIPKSADKHRS